MHLYWLTHPKKFSELNKLTHQSKSTHKLGKAALDAAKLDKTLTTKLILKHDKFFHDLTNQPSYPVDKIFRDIAITLSSEQALELLRIPNFYTIILNSGDSAEDVYAIARKQPFIGKLILFHMLAIVDKNVDLTKHTNKLQKKTTDNPNFVFIKFAKTILNNENAGEYLSALAISDKKMAQIIFSSTELVSLILKHSKANDYLHQIVKTHHIKPYLQRSMPTYSEYTQFTENDVFIIKNGFFNALSKSTIDGSPFLDNTLFSSKTRQSRLSKYFSQASWRPTSYFNFRNTQYKVVG